MRQSTLEAGAGRLGAGGEDHLVGAESGNIGIIEQGVELDPDLEPGQLPFVPVEKIEDLATARLHAGEAELAAKARRASTSVT